MGFGERSSKSWNINLLGYAVHSQALIQYKCSLNSSIKKKSLNHTELSKKGTKSFWVSLLDQEAWKVMQLLC